MEEENLDDGSWMELQGQIDFQSCFVNLSIWTFWTVSM
jgi:hypothetical protein